MGEESIFSQESSIPHRLRQAARSDLRPVGLEVQTDGLRVSCPVFMCWSVWRCRGRRGAASQSEMFCRGSGRVGKPSVPTCSGSRLRISRAALMLTLKAEQAAIKTVSPLEWSWSDCLLLSQIPQEHVLTFLSFTSLSSSPGSLTPSVNWLSLLRSLLVGASEYLYSFVIYPLTLASHPIFTNLLPLSVSATSLLFIPLFSRCLVLPAFVHPALPPLSGSITSVAQ